ncbi:MAG: Sialic acid TRAP transporter permease protein SiaT [Syntrophorhabdaceae bacterium PtaU1.Bin034]|nr:MAG: Sialic acid TRAP transporter permease protein SiaT [Syntrophorhabdaceae bacterium PtaU1.Bin034]
MSEVTVGILGICGLLILFLTGIEMAFAMAFVGFAGYVILVSLKGAMTMISKDFFDTFASYGFTVIPLFVLMGQVSYNAGIANRLYNSANRFMGHIPGGLALATVAGVTIFKTICGSAAATNATFAAVAVPEMDRFKYSKKLSTGVVAVSGTLGVLLPPSVVLIIFGMVTEQSIGKLFLAGMVPGIFLAALFAAVIVGWCRVNPAIGPRSTRHTWKEKLSSLPEVVWPLVIFVLMIGGLMGGVFTPTEAGSVGTLAVILLTIAKRDIGLRGIVQSIVECLRTGCMVLTLIACSAVLGHFIAVTNIPTLTADWVVSLPVHRSVIMIIIFLIYLVGGSIIDDLAFLILATPIFFPAITKLGYDPLWAGIMLCLTVVVGGVIPPVAMNVFIVKNITKVPIGIIYRGVYPFLISMILLIVLIFIFPQIVLYLPHTLMK